MNVQILHRTFCKNTYLYTRGGKTFYNVFLHGIFEGKIFVPRVLPRNFARRKALVSKIKVKGTTIVLPRTRVMCTSNKHSNGVSEYN